MDLFKPSPNEIPAKFGSHNSSNSRSMISLSRIQDTSKRQQQQQQQPKANNRSAAAAKKLNRYSEMITSDMLFSLASSDNLDNLANLSLDRAESPSPCPMPLPPTPPPRPPPTQLPPKETAKRNKQMTTTITKHCISNPCAFQHINSLKDNDQHVKLLIETFGFGAGADRSSEASAADMSLIKLSKSFFKKH